MINIHKDWITQISYIEDINALISASVDGTLTFIDINRFEIMKTFTSHHNSLIGVCSFDYSAMGKYLVSAADRNLLFWDPFTFDVMNRMENLRAPVVKVMVLDNCQKLIACLACKTIMMWHYISFELHQVITDSTHYKPLDVLSAMVWCKERNTLFTAGNRVALWKLERPSETSENREGEDLCCVLYNALFNQIVLVKSLGTVKVYQSEVSYQHLSSRYFFLL
jgi:WD40 repeat protein